jgi:hypothetical protein
MWAIARLALLCGLRHPIHSQARAGYPNPRQLEGILVHTCRISNGVFHRRFDGFALKGIHASWTESLTNLRT